MIDPSKNIPIATSTDEQWMSWHGKLKKVFGKKQANDIFLYAWSKRGGLDSIANTNKLSNYAEKNGFDIERSSLSNIGEGISDTVNSVTNYASIMKWVMIIGLGVTAIILFKILWGLSKDPNKTIGQVASLTPTGKSAKAIRG